MINKMCQSLQSEMNGIVCSKVTCILSKSYHKKACMTFETCIEKITGHCQRKTQIFRAMTIYGKHCDFFCVNSQSHHKVSAGPIDLMTDNCLSLI